MAKLSFQNPLHLVASVVLLLVVVNAVVLLTDTSPSITGYQVAASCSDSDGGNNITVVGTVTATSTVGTALGGTDSCANATHVQEYYCSGTTSVIANRSCGSSISIRCLNGRCVVLPIAQAGTVAVFPTSQLSINLENRTLTINNASRALTVLRIRGASNTLTLSNGYQNHFIYISVGSTAASGTPYIGNIIYYNYTSNAWQNISLRIGYISYDNIASTTASDAGRAITYTTNNLTNARVSQARILISGSTFALAAGAMRTFSGTIQVTDAFNSTALATTGQGGTWQVGFSNVGFGENLVFLLGSAYSRVARYVYYAASTGPLNENCATTSCSSISQLPTSYRAPVRVTYFRSPAGVYLQTLNPTTFTLLEDPFIEEDFVGPENVETFQFTCAKSDAGDIFTSGTISLRNPDQPTVVYTVPQFLSSSIYGYPRDICYLGSPGGTTTYANGSTTTNSSVVASDFEATCNSTSQIPTGPVTYPATLNCPTPACNAGLSACAPASTTFTCAYVAPVTTTLANGTVLPITAGNVTIIASTGNTWTFLDRCDYSSPYSAGGTSGYANVFRISCGEGGTYARTSVACPSATLANGTIVATRCRYYGSSEHCA